MVLFVSPDNLIMFRISIHPIFKLLCTSYFNHQGHILSLVLFSSPKPWSLNSRFCCLLLELLNLCSTRNTARKTLEKMHYYIVWEALHFLEGLKKTQYQKNPILVLKEHCNTKLTVTYTAGSWNADFSIGFLCLGVYTHPPILSPQLFYHFFPPSYGWLLKLVSDFMKGQVFNHTVAESIVHATRIALAKWEIIHVSTHR